MIYLLSHSSAGEAITNHRLNYDLDANENQFSPSCKQTNRKLASACLLEIEHQTQPSSTGRFSQPFSGSVYFSTVLISIVKDILKD